MALENRSDYGLVATMINDMGCTQVLGVFCVAAKRCLETTVFKGETRDEQIEAMKRYLDGLKDKAGEV